MTAIDRKARVREYKESARTMGVFRVRNVDAGISLVGTSVDVPAMLNRQRFQLEAGGHPNRALQADFDALGEAGFAFETLDVLEPSPESDAEIDPSEELAALEVLWRDRLTADGERLYNPTPGRLQ